MVVHRCTGWIQLARSWVTFLHRIMKVLDSSPSMGQIPLIFAEWVTLQSKVLSPGVRLIARMAQNLYGALPFQRVFLEFWEGRWPLEDYMSSRLRVLSLPWEIQLAYLPFQPLHPDL